MQANILVSTQARDTAASSQTARHLASLAKQSLIAEAELTPKPGLVDCRGPGAHHDLSLDLMQRSAAALEPYFSEMALLSVGRGPDIRLRTELASVGRDAERGMYRVTQGSNTHKGAIWVLGLLVAAAARRDDRNAEEIAAGAGAIARIPDQAQPALVTHGDIVRRRYGVSGARGEACLSFPHVIRLGLPMLRRQRRAGCSDKVSRLDALLNIMSELDDTCVLYRGGEEALVIVKSGSGAVLAAGGCGSENGRIELRKLDAELTAKHISPGGSADLLAATIFLDAIERKQTEINRDQSEWEEKHGAA
ncbi:MAG: triphosphoribosyl-dephospho-CoA synthase [Planctomycetaceae bacterium]|nr:triphosphoribosyl-dephospho-CoA synthase [Planctomycetaceae bacterium]